MQTDRLVDKQTFRQLVMQSGRQVFRQTGTQVDMQAGRQVDMQTGRHIDIQILVHYIHYTVFHVSIFREMTECRLNCHYNFSVFALIKICSLPISYKKVSSFVHKSFFWSCINILSVPRFTENLYCICASKNMKHYSDAVHM